MAPVKAWKCEVCGYVHEQAEPLEKCPVCGVGWDMFSPMETSISESQAEASPSSASGTIAIIGAGIAGLTAAERAREQDKDSRILLISDEQRLPYYRLNLTRLLAGEVDEKKIEIHPKSWFESKNIELVFGDVAEIDLSGGRLKFGDNRDLAFGKLILASGSHPFVPPFPGVSRKGVHVLRSLDHALEILEAARPGARGVCVGGGLLGLENASALARRGVKMQIIENYGWLLPRQLPEPAGKMVKSIMESLGIGILSRAKVKEIGGDERVRSVILEDGTELPADFVVISAGVRPNSFLARKAGLKVERGVIVDDRMFTSHPNVLAAGDVAEHRGECQGIWSVAYAEGMVAGVNAAGGDAEYHGMPRSNRLKVAEVNLFSIGAIEGEDGGYEILEDQKDNTYKRLVIRDGRIVGGVLVGDTSLSGKIKEAVEANRQVSESGELLASFSK